MNIDREDVPKVGTICEFLSITDVEHWCAAKVDFVGDHLLLVSYEHPNSGSQEACLNHRHKNPGWQTRLRRTKEQIEAEKRAAKVDELVKRFAFPEGYPVPWKALFEKMYDCGVFK